MVKLKKALKKLAKLGASAGKKAPLPTKAAAAKKDTPMKKKTGSVPGAKGKKAPAKAAGKKASAKEDTKKLAKKAAGAKKPEAPAKGKKALVPAKAAEPAKGKKALVATEPAKGKKAPAVAAPEALNGHAPAKGKGKEAKAEKPEKVLKTKKAPKEEVELEAPAIEEDEGPEEVILTDAEGRRYCRVKECDQIAMVEGYCRYHYLLFWKKIQVRKKILTEGKLERYIEDLTARYPDKYLEMLRKDLRSEKEFLAAITELEIDESGVDTEYEDEAQSYLEEVRGMSGEGGGSAREEEEF